MARTVPLALAPDVGSAGRRGWCSRAIWLAALVVTWRLWADPASRTVAGNAGDADLFAWYMRYAAAAIAHGQLPALVDLGAERAQRHQR